MGFFQSSITVLQKLVVAIGCGLGAWGLVNLLEGYGQDNPGAKSQGIKQLMAGGGIAAAFELILMVDLECPLFLQQGVLRRRK